MQRTCCQRTEVLVTSGDVARIEASVGTRDFHEWRVPPDPSYSDPDPADPRWHLWTVRADGKRRVLKQEPTGDCVFLGAGGCTLAREVRPLICRLYPLAYTEAGIVGESAEYCPSALLQPPDGRMALLLRMDELDVRRWHTMLYRELKEDQDRDEGRSHLRSA